MKRIVWIIIAAAAAVGVFFAVKPRPTPVAVGQPERITVREFIAEEAKTRLADEYIIDMPIAGTLERMELEVGDVVAAGQVVARVDPFELEQQIRGVDYMIAQARAQIAGVDMTKTKPEDVSSAEVRVKETADALDIAKRDRSIAAITLKEARRAYDRARKLVAEGVASDAMLDEAERRFKSAEESLSRAELAEQAASKNLEIARLNARRTAGSVDDNEYLREVYQAEVEALEAQRAVLESDLRKSEIRAPVAGPVLEKYVENRRVMAPGSPLLKVGDLATMEIESDILSEEVGRVREGAPVEVVGKALLGASVTGKVSRIYPSAFKKISSLGIEQQRVKVLIDFDNGELNLRAGTRLDVRIITAESGDTIAVPERATFRQDNQWYVFTVEGGKARLREVTLGLKNDEWAEVLEGLSETDTIVTEPLNSLEPGTAVVAKS